jgi:acyl transferase domain-containing protein/phosphopantetheinyl transferase
MSPQSRPKGGSRKAQPEGNPVSTPDSRANAPIAIIGMACIFPQAPDLQTFWNNVLSGVDAIGEPVADWGAQRYLDAGRIKTQFGGFLRDLYRFDPREFGIMPNSVDGGETDHYLALRVARDALVDAGYGAHDADHKETGIVLGHSAYLHRGQVTVIQQNIVLDQTMDLLKVALPHMDEAALAQLRQMLSKKTPPTNADNAPGLVPNMMTGRIANRLNLRGPNYVLDAACTSSLLAVSAAIDELRTGRSRMMLAGGVNATLPADVSTSFTQLGALSARGKVRPFEAGSDGTLLGEGLGVVVLKRLDDAIADGDRVYAVLRGVGLSSDGRGTGLLAPSHDGEALAMKRAYDASGISPASIGLVEAHGTGIPLGDQTEIASLKTVFGERDTPVGVKALGSVKSMISHCIPAAGIASLIKMSLSLHHRVLPPTLCDQVNPALGIDKTPFYVNTQTAPWMARLGEPRRAAVNSFGFGGINGHAIVEQAPPTAIAPKRLTAWPAELCVLSADTGDALLSQLDQLAAGLARNPGWKLAEVAAALAARDTGQKHRMAIVAKDTTALAKSIGQALKKLREGSDAPWSTRSGVAYSSRRIDGKLAFLFPGEGSQYPGMFADLAQCFGEMQHWLDFWHGLYDLPLGSTRTDIVFPSSEIGAERRAQLEHRLHDMDVGSEAVFIGGMAMHELLVSLGVQADVMMGHSSGESAALGACGANPATSPQELAACISQHFAVYDELLKAGKIPTGALLAVGALPPDTVEEQLAAIGPDVVVAMDNCANQIVLYGAPDGIARVQKALTALGGICMPLPFDRGYHTPVFAEVSAAFLKYYRNIKLDKPKVPLYSCASVGLFPESVAAVRQLAAAQWSQKVRFRETVLKMHDDGVRLFVEVGPSGNLTAFVNDILIDREFAALSTNVRRRSGVEQFLSVLGHLYVAGRGADLQRLFAGREIQVVDLDALQNVRQRPLLDNTMPMVRLSEADRDLVRRLTAAPAAPAAAAAEPPPVASAASAALAASAQPADGAQERVLPGAEPQGSGERERVMAEYFEVMRGFLDQQRALVERLPLQHEAPMAAAPADDATAAGWPSTHANDSRTPLLDTIVEHDDNQVVAHSTVGLLNDQFIRDHVLSGAVAEPGSGVFGLACVPFMVSLELMAEACGLLAGRYDVKAIENVKAFDWIALDDGELTIEVRAQVVDRARGHFAAQVVTRRGIAVSAEVRFETPWRLAGVAPLANPQPWNIDVPHMYVEGRYAMFHGPVFRSMERIDGWDEGGIDVSLSRVSLTNFFSEGHTPNLVLNPVLLDAMGQVVPCWLVQYVGPEFHSFPSTIDRIEFYEPCPADRGGIVLRARQRPADPSAPDISAPKAWDFECTDGEGRVLMRGHDLVNLFFRVTPSYHAARTHPLGGWLGGPAAPSPVAGVTLWQLPMMPEDLCTLSGGICLRIMAQVLLAPEERDEWRAFQGNLRRKREWLFGRAALKEAVRHWVHEQTGELLYATDVLVRHDDQGAPYVDGGWCETLIAAPQVSLSHTGEACLAAVAAPDRPVGVDLEEVARLRQPDLILGALAPEERRWVEGLDGAALAERVLRLWCAKEAAAKCLGTGLQGQPEAFQVVRSDAKCENLLVESAWGAVDTCVQRLGGTIIAIATQTLGDIEVHG